ncbi:MAG: hypothetical protein ICV83_05970 [Cytophagales bacterium]|nr:hypothetical protein [Cytophagales bacterium]
MLVTCQMEVEGRQLVSVLDSISNLLEAHPGSRLLLDFKNLVALDAPSLSSITGEWLPAMHRQGLRMIALVPPTKKRAVAAIEGLKASAAQLGFQIATFASTEGAHQWLTQH